MPPSRVHFNGSVNLPDTETVMREITRSLRALVIFAAGLRLVLVGGRAVSSGSGSVACFKPLLGCRCGFSPAEPAALNRSLHGKRNNGAGQAKQEPIGREASPTQRSHKAADQDA
jgi:hypothetical protein